jgi:Phosphotransferase enzyme family
MEPGVAGALWTQPQVHDLEQFLHGPAAQQRLRTALSQLLPTTHALGRCRLEWVEFKPGRKLVAHYQVEARRPNDDAGDFRPIALIWTPQREAGDNGDELPSLEELQRDARVRKLTGPWQRLVADFPECCLRVQGWPLDSPFPQLVRVSDSCHVREMLRAASVIDPASDYLVVPVRYRPGERHVLLYTRADGRTHLADPIFAKLYESSASAARAFRVANRVGDLLAASDSTLRSVRPVGCVAHDAVVLYPRILGTPLSEHLRRAGPALAQHLGQAGSMLRILHTETQATPGECRGASGMGLSDELTAHRGFAKEVKKITRRTCEHIHALLPELGARINAMLARAANLYDGLPQELPTFAHGDFKTEHLWIGAGGLTVMDFDTCCLADPALDVGKLLADLEYWYSAYNQEGVKQAQTHFLSAYASGTPTDRVRRAWPYAALTLVKLAVHRLRLCDDDWPARTAHLVGRAEAILEEQGENGHDG